MSVMRTSPSLCLAAVVSLLGIAGCVSVPSQAEGPSAVPLSSPVNLGPGLFEPGSDSMTPSGTDIVLARLAAIPPDSPVAVEVFADAKSLEARHVKRENVQRLSELRAAALAAFVRAQGFTIVSARGRGLDRVDGIEPDRRALVYVVDRPKSPQPTGSSPTYVVKTKWPAIPATDGEGPDEAFLVTSITIDGLEKAGLTDTEVGVAEIQMDTRAPAWGRPMAGKVPLGALAKPVSPLCLYRGEMERIAEALVKAIKDKGFAGINVKFADPPHPVDGVVRCSVSLAMISEVRVEDRRASRTPRIDPDAVRMECPLKVGDYLRRSVLDSCSALLSARFHTEVDVTISAKEGQESGQAVVTVILQPARSK